MRHIFSLILALGLAACGQSVEQGGLPTSEASTLRMLEQGDVVGFRPAGW